MSRQIQDLDFQKAEASVSKIVPHCFIFDVVIFRDCSCTTMLHIIEQNGVNLNDHPVCKVQYVHRNNNSYNAT
jgi:hypothetical protein